MPVSKDDLLNNLTTELDRAMDLQGITPQLLAKKLKEELDYKEDDGLTPAAMAVRQRARQDIHKLRNDFPAQEQRISGPAGEPLDLRPITIRFVAPGEVPPAVEAGSWKDKLKTKKLLKGGEEG